MVRGLAASLLLVVAVAYNAAGALVNNATTTTTAEDFVAVPFCMLDSIGNPTTADSLVVAVSDASGELVYVDSLAIGDSRVFSESVTGCIAYTFADLAANLGGESSGCYELLLVSKNATLELCTVHRSRFQVIGRRLSEALSEIDDTLWVRGGAIDSNRTERGVSDSSQVADWVWNAPHSEHTLAGTFGDYLDADVSGLGIGGGAYSVGLVAYDSSSMQPVPGARVAVRSLSQSTLIALGGTDSEGWVSFNLDAGSYLVLAVSTGYLFAPFDTLTVAGATVDTVRGTRFDPGEPSVPGLCRVYGYVYAIDGTPIEGARIEARLPDGVNGASILLLAPFAVETTSNAEGYFAVDLIPSVGLYPQATDYEITISASGRILYRKQVTVPATGALHLTP